MILTYKMLEILKILTKIVIMQRETCTQDGITVGILQFDEPD